METEATSNSNVLEQENYSSNFEEKIESKDNELNIMGLDCSDEIKEIIMKLVLEVKEYEKALENYQFKYMKKKISKKESLKIYEQENLEIKKIITLLKDIIMNITEYREIGVEYLVKKLKD